MSLNEQLLVLLKGYHQEIEASSGRDCLAYYGPMKFPIDGVVRRAIEAIPNRKDDLLVILSHGGEAWWRWSNA